MVAAPHWRKSGRNADDLVFVSPIASSPLLQPPTWLRSGYQLPRVTELPRRWDPVQGREIVVLTGEPHAAGALLAATGALVVFVHPSVATEPSDQSVELGYEALQSRRRAQPHAVGESVARGPMTSPSTAANLRR
jgi:hypothetical protein